MNLRHLFFASFCVCLLSTLGWGHEIKNDLTVHLASDVTTLVSQGTALSCRDQAVGSSYGSIRAPYFHLPLLTLNWTNPEAALEITGLRVTIEDDALEGGHYKCLLSITELNFLFNLSSPRLHPLQSVMGPSMNGLACQAACGDLRLRNPNEKIKLPATLSILATSLSRQGEEPFRLHIPFFIETFNSL